jgi:hypothetical protein
MSIFSLKYVRAMSLLLVLPLIILFNLLGFATPVWAAPSLAITAGTVPTTRDRFSFAPTVLVADVATTPAVDGAELTAAAKTAAKAAAKEAKQVAKAEAKKLEKQKELEEKAAKAQLKAEKKAAKLEAKKLKQQQEAAEATAAKEEAKLTKAAKKPEAAAQAAETEKPTIEAMP